MRTNNHAFIVRYMSAHRKAKAALSLPIKRSMRLAWSHIKQEFSGHNPRVQKADGVVDGVPTGFETWGDEFEKALRDGLTAALLILINQMRPWFEAQGMNVDYSTPEELLNAYYARIGGGNPATRIIHTRRELLQNAIAVGMTAQQVSDELDPLFSSDQSDEIADTETSDLLAWMISDFLFNNNVLDWQWIARMDSVTCPDCAAKNGIVYGQFDMKPPEHGRCRCIPVPVRNG